MPTFVVHICRNKQCDAIWIDKDLTNAQVNPPDWKYCEDCCKELGIDFDSQTPDSNLTPKELEHKNRLRERIKKANQVRLQNIKSASTDRLINPS